jgi:hypothetical protein
MSVQTETHERKQKANFRLRPEDINYLAQHAQKRGFINPRGGYDESKSISEIIQTHRSLGLQTSEEFKPEGCKNCIQYGGVTKEAVVCIIKRSDAEPVRSIFMPFPIAQICSMKPFNTPVDKKTHQQFKTEIELITTQRDIAIDRNGRYYRKIESSKGIEKERDNALSEIERLNEVVKRVPVNLKEIDSLRKSFKEKNDECVTLTEDNDFLRKTNEELSHDPLTEKYKELLDRYEQAEQLLKVRESNYSANQEESEKEIVKLEALVKVGREQNNDIVFTIKKALRDFKQFLPEGSASCVGCPDGFKFKEYKQNALKAIENLEGYLQTKAS